MSVELNSNVIKSSSETNSDKNTEGKNGEHISCVSRNALFCCPSPVCLTNTTKLEPVTDSTITTNYPNIMESQTIDKFPVMLPDLSNPIYNNGTQNLIEKSNTEQTINNGTTTAYTSATESSANSVAPIPKPVETSNNMHNSATAISNHHLNKSMSAQDIRLGVSLRRVTPPKISVAVKKPETPLMGVVLRKVEKKLLEPPKPEKLHNSPPPRKLTSIKAIKPKKTKALNNQNAIVKSKSTNDVASKQKENISNGNVTGATAGKPLPTVNLLKSHRPPLEIHKIEGDKIIIIRRVPRSRRVQEPNCARSLPVSPDQVTIQLYHDYDLIVNNKNEIVKISSYILYISL